MEVNYANKHLSNQNVFSFINVAEESVTPVFSKRRWLNTKPFRAP